MPLGGPYLSSADISTIASWIDGLTKQGSANSGSSGPIGTGQPVAGSAPTATPSTSAGGAAAGSSGATGQQVSFKNDVQPLFQARCSACHIAAQSGGLNLAGYQGLIKGGSVVPGSVVKAGDPQGSVLYQIISPSGPYPGGQRMPFGGPYLDNTQIQTISNWIKQGAKDN